jgi:hypothetical protein
VELRLALIKHVSENKEEISLLGFKVMIFLLWAQNST